MAQLNITLNQEEILGLLASDTGGAFGELLRQALDAVMRAESQEQLRAAPYERAEGRTDMRNGTRQRPLTTRLGTIVLTVPRHREVPFRTLVFDNYKRSEAALVTTMAEMVVAGVSTAKVGRVMKEICGRPFSKQAVSEACAELDDAVRAFRERRLDGDYLFVMADATYLRAREDHRVQSKALMIAVGLTADGRKEVIGLDVAGSESRECWAAFLSSLRGRGLHGVRMFTSDACDGLVDAIQETFPGVPWQRCQAHFARNVSEGAPKALRAGLRSELAEMFNCRTAAEARARRDEIIADYSEMAPKAMECLDAGFDDAMTVMELPEQMRQCTRTTNIIERLNREVKRRAKVIGVFPNPASVMRLMGAVLLEEDDRWRTKGRLYYAPAVARVDEGREALAAIACRQRQLRLAA